MSDALEGRQPFADRNTPEKRAEDIARFAGEIDASAEAACIAIFNRDGVICCIYGKPAEVAARIRQFSPDKIFVQMGIEALSEIYISLTIGQETREAGIKLALEKVAGLRRLDVAKLQLRAAGRSSDIA